jgi:hypothetical protein
VIKTARALAPNPLRPPVAGLSGLIRAAGLARLDLAALTTSRRAPGPIPESWRPLSPTLLKTSDDQTVAAVNAVLDAIATHHPDVSHDAFAEWGIVVASRYLGRAQLAVALRRFAAEGVWGVSPHLIPHFALHSPAGTLSVALGSHGPNLGVGGGPGSAMDGALAALTWLSEGRLPGVWLVLTGHEPDLIPDAKGAPVSPTECRALALALEPDSPVVPGPRLRLVSGLNDKPAAVDLVAHHARLAAVMDDASTIYHPHIDIDPTSAGPSHTIAAASGLRLEWATEIRGTR